MKKHSQFLVQATILATAGLIARLLGFLYRIPMQNILGDAGTGVYGQGFNLYMFFFVLSSAGMPAAISKMVSKRVALRQHQNALKVLKVALILSGTLGLIGMVALFFLAPTFAAFFSSQHVIYSLQALAPTVFIVAIMSVFRGYFQGLGNSMPTAVSQVVEQILNAIFSVLLVYILIDEGIGIAAAGGTAASGIGAFFGLIFIFFVYRLGRDRQVRKIKKYKHLHYPESGKKIAIEIIFTAAPIVAGTAIFSITNIIDTRMVVTTLMSTGFTYYDALGLFGQLNGKYVVITTLPVAIATAIATALIPSISSSVTLNEKEVTRQKINMALKFTMIICIPAAVGIGVMANQILLFLFPANPEGAILLQFGSVSVLFLALTQVATGILHGMHILKVPLIAALLGAVVKILLNYLLIPLPQINVLGAVISTTVCYIIASIINLTAVYKVAHAKIDFAGIFIKPILSSLIMGIVCYITFYLVYLIYPSNSISLIVAIAFSILSYFFSMIFIGGLTKVEMSYLPMGSRLTKLLDRVGM